jgi:pSer/pThr/pTyr-binding forkhead associated (FHA) protein
MVRLGRWSLHGTPDAQLGWSVLAEYNMNKERYTIGRLPDNDIRIDNPAVSGHHSLIINILNDSFLEDLNSTNGTYVNGKLIKKHAMQHGDVITVGHHQLRFVDSQDGETEQDEFEKTMVITPSTQGEERIRRSAWRSTRPPRPSRQAPHRPAGYPGERDRVAQGEAAGAERRLRRPRTGIDQGAHHAGPSRRPGGRHHAARRRLLHRARRQRQGKRLSRRSTACPSVRRRAA